MGTNYSKKRHIQESNQKLENRMISEKNLRGIIINTITEGYLDKIVEGDDLCDIVCRRKQAKYGSTGSVVKQLQSALAKCGSNVEKQGGGIMDGCKDDFKNCDGIFKDETQKAVKDFQTKNGLTPDGSVGYNTLDKMYDKGCLKLPDCKCEEKETKKDGGSENWWSKIGFVTNPVDCDGLNHCLYVALTSSSSFDYSVFIKCLKSGGVFNIPKPSPYEGKCKRCPAYYNNQPGPGNSSDLPPYIQKCLEDGCTKIVS